MAPPRLDRKCGVEGCGRRHAAHGFCLMHYKRLRKNGTADYRWGGKAPGRPCAYCERPVVAREMCDRHYQMLRRHGDALYADKKKVAGLPPGLHIRRGYLIESDGVDDRKAVIPDATVEKAHRHHARQTEALGLRTGNAHRRKSWVHRRVAGAAPGQVVHHIDGNPLNNDPLNLHVFDTPREHALAHRSLELVAYGLFRAGAIEFDKVSGTYSIRGSDYFPAGRELPLAA